MVTTQPLETKPRARVVSNTGLADRDPKGQKVKRDASRIAKPPKGTAERPREVSRLMNS